MKRFLIMSLAAVAVLAVVATKAAQSQDIADLIIELYRDGNLKAQYFVQVHDDPMAGQFWEITSTIEKKPDHKTVTKWQVVKVVGESVFVEYDMGQGYVLAFEVDGDKSIEKATTSGNVLNAWIGKPGEKGEKIQIMDVPEMLEEEDPNNEDGPDLPESTIEDFADEEIAGGTWSGKKTVTEHGSNWIADNGWFGGMVRYTYKSGKLELTAFGDKGKPWLLWEDDKKTEATDPMAEWQKLHAPGKQHKLLAGLAGSWEMEIKMWFGGPDDPVVVKGSVEKKMTLGGRFLSTEYELKESVMAHKGLEMIGHDNASGKFQLLQVTSIGTGMRVDTGVYDEAASTITFTSAPYTFEFGGQKMQVTTEHLLKIDSKDKHTVIQQTTYPKPMGTIKEVVIVYTRKK